MEDLKAEVNELNKKLKKLQEDKDKAEERLKKVEEDKEQVKKRWQEEKNEILVNAQEVVSEGERRMEESVKEVEERLKEEMKKVKKMTAEDCEHKKNTLVNLKMMTPSVYKDGSSWKDWREEIEDYTDEVYEGMADELKRVREINIVIDKDTLKNTWWDKRQKLWTLLKKFTEGEAKRIITNEKGRNGWEAWRRLNKHVEPSVAVKEAQVLGDFSKMIESRAQTPAQTKAKLVELEEKARRIEDILGEAVDNKHKASVIMGVLDMDTLRAVSQTEGSCKDAEQIKRRALEFIKIMENGTSNFEKGKLKAVEENEHGEDLWWKEGGGEADKVEIYGLGETCHKCGGVGHYARECPSKGKGKGKIVEGKGDVNSAKGRMKGKGKGDEKGGKGKGKAKGFQDKRASKGKGPQYRGCYSCGGPHFSRDCPKGAAGNGAVKCLSSVQEIKGKAEDDGTDGSQDDAWKIAKRGVKKVVVKQDIRTTVMSTEVLIGTRDGVV